METTVKERLKMFIKHLGLSQRDFEIKLGWSNSYVNNTKNFGSDKLISVFVEYPLLNIEWLLMGKGEMLKQDDPLASVKITDANDYLAMHFERVIGEKIMIANKLAEKEKEIELLKEEVNRLKEEKKENISYGNVAEKIPELKPNKPQKKS